MSESGIHGDHEDDPFWLSGKDLDRHFVLEDALFEFTRLFKYEESNDRALAIVGAAFLDSVLEHILVAFLVEDAAEVGELLRYDQPLGTYGGRVRISYCLGLIGKVVAGDLRLVGKIRNRFAHDLKASFQDQQIVNWCRALQWHRKAYMTPSDDASPRDLFHVGVNRLVGHLHGIVSIAWIQKRKAQ